MSAYITGVPSCSLHLRVHAAILLAFPRHEVRGGAMYLALELLSMSRMYDLEETWLIRRALEMFGDFFLKTAENSNDLANGVVRWILRQALSFSSMVCITLRGSPWISGSLRTHTRPSTMRRSKELSKNPSHLFAISPARIVLSRRSVSLVVRNDR